MSNPRETALDLIEFLDASPSPYHAIAEALRRLAAP
jgi:aspartyl aminopeptidase